jgi:hypothetical protein
MTKPRLLGRRQFFFASHDRLLGEHYSIIKRILRNARTPTVAKLTDDLAYTENTVLVKCKRGSTRGAWFGLRARVRPEFFGLS